MIERMFNFRNCIIQRNQFFKLFFINCLYNEKQIIKHCSMLIASKHDLAIKKQVPAEQITRPVNKYTLRTHTCGELNIQNVGDNVCLYGWLYFQRMQKFMVLRDSYGVTQLIIPSDRKDLKDIAKHLTLESVIKVFGTVCERPMDQKNKELKTGDIEVKIKVLEVLNMATPNLPLSIREFNEAKESIQMKYRYLALRDHKLQRNLKLRSQVIAKMREYLIKECDFIDIETPTLFKNTPGGAQEFIVPTQYPGQFYSLVQSPQQFKQLLMIGGLDRYFQIAKCYRDESGRQDRQPEFTQLDIEMSFVNCKDVMKLIENVLMYSWPEKSAAITSPFKCLTYNEAMELYGTDKPDLRIPQQLYRLTGLINHLVLEQYFKIKWSDNYEMYALVFCNKQNFLTTFVQQNILMLQQKYFPSVKLFQLKIVKEMETNKLYSNIVKEHIKQKLNLNEGDVLFLAFGEKRPTQSLLGKVRIEFANQLENQGETIYTPGNKILWITDFPLFSFDTVKKKLKSMHHPFTQPHPCDIKYLFTDPIKVRGLHYDLVMNGSEIAGGSIRIHNAQLQRQILKILDIDESSLIHMLDALACGAPPHGGIALGLDRLICLLCNAKNIKSVIAFPKTTEGRDLMSGAPISISDTEKILYHIQTIEKKQIIKT